MSGSKESLRIDCGRRESSQTKIPSIVWFPQKVEGLITFCWVPQEKTFLARLRRKLKESIKTVWKYKCTLGLVWKSQLSNPKRLCYFVVLYHSSYSATIAVTNAQEMKCNPAFIFMFFIYLHDLFYGLNYSVYFFIFFLSH